MEGASPGKFPTIDSPFPGEICGKLLGLDRVRGNKNGGGGCRGITVNVIVPILIMCGGQAILTECT